MMELEDGEKSFWLELYRPGYIQEDSPSMDSLIISVQMYLQSEKIERFLHLAGDVLAIDVLKFKHWLERILFHEEVEEEFFFSPALSFKYFGRTASNSRFRIELAFMDSYYFEKCNFYPYPQDIFQDDEFSLEISAGDNMLSKAISELINNFNEEVERFTGKSF